MSDGSPSVFHFGDLTKPLVKIIDVIASAGYTLFEPTKVLRLARAEAEASVIKARSDAQVTAIESQAEGEAAKSRAEIDAEIALILGKTELELKDLEARTMDRIKRREERRQRNIESINTKAVIALVRQVTEPNAGKSVLSLLNTVSDEKPDDDWVQEFFNHCQDVGSEQMQVLWAKILAGEVANPGTFSLRTLSIVKTLRKLEADIFTRFCSYVWVAGRPIAVVGALDVSPHWNSFTPAITKRDLTVLQSIGLIEYDWTINRILIRKADKVSQVPLSYFGTTHILSPKVPNKEWQVYYGQASLTPSGEELVFIAGAQPDEEYRQRVVQAWRSKDLQVAEL